MTIETEQLSTLRHREGAPPLRATSYTAVIDSRKRMPGDKYAIDAPAPRSDRTPDAIAHRGRQHRYIATDRT